MQVLGAASAAGMGLARYADADAATAQKACTRGPVRQCVVPAHDGLPTHRLKPTYFREPSVNIGVGAMQGQLPHLVGSTC